MAGTVQLGMFLLVLCGLAASSTIILGKVMGDMRLPYWYIMAGSNFLMAVAFGFLIIATQASLPQRCQWKWVLGRSLFGTLSLVAAILAVQVGAAPGDVASLTSINIVIAAVMGHLFLKERLNCIHVFALMCSILGAVLISKPVFLFGAGEQGSSWMGYLSALASGFLQANEFIFARKSADVSVNVLSLFMSVIGIPVFATLALLEEGMTARLATAVSAPWIFCAFVAATTALGFLAIGAGTAGSSMCPAAISATAFTASSMVIGYFAQSMFFGQAPSPLTVAGAAIMLLAVFVMQATRVPKPDGKVPSGVPSDITTVKGSSTVSLDDEVSNITQDDDSESLVSFVAAEFATIGPHAGTVRFRHTVASEHMSADVIGAISKVATAATMAV